MAKCNYLTSLPFKGLNRLMSPMNVITVNTTALGYVSWQQ